jgi:hypothetical protein
MKDDTLITNLSRKTLIILGEVKTRAVNINSSWRDKSKENMERALRALGKFPVNKVKNIAEELYRNGFFENKNIKITWICIGSERNTIIENSYPSIPIILFDEMLEFIYDRFSQYYQIKVSHNQWDKTGKQLFDGITQHNKEEYKKLFDVKV